VNGAPKVFISYSHDGEAHETRVLDLTNRLRDEGVDAEIDQHEVSPPEGWPTWCERWIKQADFVVMVCTEFYLRRFDDADPGSGLGVLWEARNIRQLIYDDRAKTGKYVPVLFDGGSAEHIPTPVKGATRWEVDTVDGYEGLYRQLTRQPKVIKRVLGTIIAMPPKTSRSGPAATAAPSATPVTTPAPPCSGGTPHARVGEVFVGRKAQLAVLAGCLLPDDAAQRRPVAVMGMGGVGKSYLVDRFFWDNRPGFPGGYHRLALDAENPGTAADLLAALADRLKLPAAAEDATIAAALHAPLALVHVENVDTDEAAATAGDLASRLPGCALVLSARMSTLAAGTGWGEAKLASFDEAEALEQFAQELGATAPDAGTLRRIAAALGGLPLALHLAAGHLQTGETAEGFLKLLRREGVSLQPINRADPSFQERSRTRLDAVFVLSLAALERAAEAGGRPAAAWRAGFEALGWAAAAGFGESLGAAIAGLDEDDFADLARTACALSLLDRVPRGDASAFRLHPLLGEFGRARADRDTTVARITGWFCERLPKPAAGEAWRWNEVHAETAALLEWLSLVPAAERRRVERAGSWMAINTGPFDAWRRFCEAALADATDDAERSDVLWTLGKVAMMCGDPDGALGYAEQKVAVDRRREDDREAALASGLIADILQARGQLDEALRIRREEELPVYERLGDVRSRALTMGRIADILQARGQLDEALRIRREEELPVYERLGDVRSRAVTMGKIADVLASRGDLDIAIRTYRDEVLPAYVNLGEARMLVVDRGWLASHLMRRDEAGDRAEARQLLCLALSDARRMQIPQAEQIEAILEAHGLSCD